MTDEPEPIARPPADAHAVGPGLETPDAPVTGAGPDDPRDSTAPIAPMAPTAPTAPAARRPLVERIGMAAVAAVLATTFGGVAAVCFGSGEPFLGIMATLGTLMTAWVGLLTLVRG
jgi:hypothetical protein